MSQNILIRNARVFSPTSLFDPGWLLIEGRVIAGLGTGDPPDISRSRDVHVIDGQNKYLMPGFIDVHIHGALGCDTMDGTVDSLRTIAQSLPSHGVTSFLAATWAANDEGIEKALTAISNAYGSIPDGASLIGAYLEGPYLNPNRTGAQDAGQIRSAADHVTILKFLDSEMIKVVVLAPENPANLWLVDECAHRGITVSVGHSAASYEEMQVAVNHGLRHVTHCFNAMGTLHHRNPGVIGAALTMPELRCELIADNIHVHPAVQNILYQAKGPYGMMLISDSIRVTGLPDGEYPLGERTVFLDQQRVHLADGTLAGSCLSLDQAFRNFVNNVKRPLPEVWPVVSLTPARAVGIAHQKGVLEVGHDADLVLLDENLQVVMTFVEGRAVYTAPASNLQD